MTCSEAQFQISLYILLKQLSDDLLCPQRTKLSYPSASTRFLHQPWGPGISQYTLDESMFLTYLETLMDTPYSGILHLLACFPSVVVGLLLQVRSRMTTASVPRHRSKFAWLFPSSHSWYPCPPAGLSTWGRLVTKKKKNKKQNTKRGRDSPKQLGSPVSLTDSL